MAGVFAEKLNQARGPVKILVPLRGWSAIDGVSTALHDPETDLIFVDELKKRLSGQIEVREIDANLEEAEFARAVVKAFKDVMFLSRWPCEQSAGQV